MKGCLQAIGTVVILIVMFIIGYTVATSPEPSPSTSPPVSTVVPPEPAITPAVEPEPTSVPSKELPAPTLSLPTAIGEVTQSTELISANYSWIYRSKWSWEVKIPLSFYKYYQKLPRAPTRNYSVYVTHPLDDLYL